MDIYVQPYSFCPQTLQPYPFCPQIHSIYQPNPKPMLKLSMFPELSVFPEINQNTPPDASITHSTLTPYQMLLLKLKILKFLQINTEMDLAFPQLLHA